VSKYEIEMTDEAVREFIRDQRELLGGTQACHVADIFEAQIPIPVPVKVGAVVRTDTDVVGPRVYIRWAWESATTEPWIEHGDSDLTTFRTDAIGRITEVLSPGVDL
jgi:hypothetical protein